MKQSSAGGAGSEGEAEEEALSSSYTCNAKSSAPRQIEAGQWGMLCAVFAIPQCGFISFAWRKVVIFHWARADGRTRCGRAGRAERLLKYGISIYSNFILIRPRL